MNKIYEESQELEQKRSVQGSHTNRYQPLENEINNAQELLDIPKSDEKKNSYTHRISSKAGILFGLFVAALIYALAVRSVPSVKDTPEVSEARETHVSTSLAAGARLMENDERFIGGDLTITHNSDDGETTLYVWDYAAEDGDYVQVFVNGAPISDPFMIMNTPVSFKVPAVGEVKVVGTRDGGGGITYGVYYDLDHTSYFNGMDQGGENIYTLIRE